jgi:hypothetical protein
MSHSTNNSTKLNNSKTSVYKTFCKVCQDAGKTDKEYTNHNVRDRTGKTVCPVLLAQECRNCYKHGHTVKYCPLTKKATEYKKPYEAPVKAQQPKSKNVFMLLESDSEDEVEPVNEFPELKQQQQQKQVQPKVEPLNYSRLINMTEEQTKEAVIKKAEIKALPLPKPVQKGKLDWANAESDSEGDEEEEDYYPVAKKQQSKIQEDLSAW